VVGPVKITKFNILSHSNVAINDIEDLVMTQKQTLKPKNDSKTERYLNT